MSDEMVCTQCGHVGWPTKVTKGHFLIEVLLWLCFLIPGIIYSVWRLTSRHDACPMCGNPHMIPKNSPMAKKFIMENLPEAHSRLSEVSSNGSSRAHAVGNALGRMVGKAIK